jgi:uncharacterized membrane protein HdeD (DUF308 family)
MKLINDILKTPQGKWSRKSIIMISSYIVSIILGSYMVFTERNVNVYAIDVYNGFLLLSGGVSIISVYDKLKTQKDGQPISE